MGIIADQNKKTKKLRKNNRTTPFGGNEMPQESENKAEKLYRARKL